MFSQNSKKQTTLSFAPKPQAAAATAAATAARSTKTATRQTPYARAPVSRQSSSSSSIGSQTGSSSKYFGAQPSTNAAKVGGPGPRPAAVGGMPGLQRGNNFGSEPGAAVGSYRSSSAAVGARMAGARGAGAGARKAVPTTVPLPQGVSLSAGQREAFDLAVNGRESMFITGSAGTGKSVLLREIIKALKGPLAMGDDEVQVTAPTGIAAVHLQGKTIHSFSGVGYGKDSAAKLLDFVRKSRNAVRRWMAVKVLIIDEISMLDAPLFDAIEYIARTLRGQDRYFGGVQVIVTGDFYQLPPVDKSGAATFAFEAKAWATGIKRTVVLTHVFRQKDMRFVDMLNELRLGRLSDHSLGIFNGLSRTPNYPADGIMATELYALRRQVDDANGRRLAALKGNAVAFNAHDYSTKNDRMVRATEEISQKIDGACLAQRRVELKAMAQVMLIKNMPDEGLVNGSRGVVVGFSNIASRDYPIVRFTNGTELTITPTEVEVDISNAKYKRTQLPLILAWALSIHKSQGQTIDRLLVDLGKIFEKGQAYVALSRAVNLESLQVLNFSSSCVMAHPRVIQYYAALARGP